MAGYVLANGVEVPNLCYGTGSVYKYRYKDWDKKGKIKYWIKNILKDSKTLKSDLIFPKAIDTAMREGCHMFDTSRAYCGAEYILGKTLAKYKRNDFFIVTKLCNSDQIGGVEKGFRKSLLELGVEYIDLYLMHWPVKETYIESWKEIEKLYKEGLCRAIGVCNCNIHHLEELKQNVEIMPMVNQFECHPLFTQNELRAYCNENNIKVMAYTSTARMDERLLKTCLVPIADKYRKTVAQIILRWHQQIGNIPVVNSLNLAHVIEDININDFVLTENEIEKILEININSRLRYDPDNCDFSRLG